MASSRSAQLEPAADVVERLERMRDELIFAYDTETHHLAKLIEALVECEEGEELHRLHERAVLPTQPPLCLTLQHAFKLAGRKLPKQWLAVMGARRNKGVLRKMLASPAYLEWLQGYDEWVHAVVLPIIGEPFYYQRPPTLRIAMPSVAATIGVHRDADYSGHHPSEINFWVPLTPVAGSSALWLESYPNAGDFKARDMQVGQCLRFNGQLCRHHTAPNQTGATRVSFDLRVVPVSALAADEEPPTKMGDYAVGYMSADERSRTHVLGAPPPAKRPEGRNRPCPCGSTLKFKCCCGRTACEEVHVCHSGCTFVHTDRRVHEDKSSGLIRVRPPDGRVMEEESAKFGSTCKATADSDRCFEIE